MEDIFDDLLSEITDKCNNQKELEKYLETLGL